MPAFKGQKIPIRKIFELLRVYLFFSPENQHDHQKHRVLLMIRKIELVLPFLLLKRKEKKKKLIQININYLRVCIFMISTLRNYLFIRIFSYYRSKNFDIFYFWCLVWINSMIRYLVRIVLWNKQIKFHIFSNFR